MKASLDQNNGVLLSWANPGGAARVVVVRKTRDYPRNTADGAVVLDVSPPPETFADEAPALGRFNCYRAFFQDAGGSWIDAAPEDDRVLIRCEAPFGYREKLHQNLPELYERSDGNGELFRFLSILAWQLEQFRAKQAGLFDLSNVNEIRDDLLEALAWNVGWLLNRELPVLRQRAEIKRAVAVYKKKGTKSGLIDLIQGIVNWDAEIVRYNRNILTTNHPQSTTLKISDPAVTMNVDSAADAADYILGGDRSPDKIRIKIKATYDFELFDKVKNKLYRILRFWIPACMSAVLELATLNQEAGTLSDWRPAFCDVLDSNWLFTNYFSPNEWEILSERTINDPLWRTPALSSL